MQFCCTQNEIGSNFVKHPLPSSFRSYTFVHVYMCKYVILWACTSIERNWSSTLNKRAEQVKCITFNNAPHWPSKYNCVTVYLSHTELCSITLCCIMLYSLCAVHQPSEGDRRPQGGDQEAAGGDSQAEQHHPQPGEGHPGSQEGDPGERRHHPGQGELD